MCYRYTWNRLHCNQHSCSLHAVLLRLSLVVTVNGPVVDCRGRWISCWTRSRPSSQWGRRAGSSPTGRLAGRPGGRFGGPLGDWSNRCHRGRLGDPASGCLRRRVVGRPGSTLSGPFDSCLGGGRIGISKTQLTRKWKHNCGCTPCSRILVDRLQLLTAPDPTAHPPPAPDQPEFIPIVQSIPGALGVTTTRECSRNQQVKTLTLLLQWPHRLDRPSFKQCSTFPSTSTSTPILTYSELTDRP